MPLNKRSLILAKKILFFFSLSFVFIQISPDKIILAKEIEIDYGRGPTELLFVNHPDNPALDAAAPANTLINMATLKNLEYYTTYITVTAYTSRVEETDDSPFVAAWGDKVYWGMLASNAFPKNTLIQIPDYFGSKVFTILDRMNPRYYYHLDIWMPDLNNAKTWGSKYIKIVVLK